MGQFNLETSRGDILMSLPGAAPIAGAGQSGSVETATISERDSEYVRVEGGSTDFGTIAAIGFAALVTAGAALISRMALRRRSFFEARHAALQGTADSLKIDEAAKDAVTRFYDLENKAAAPLDGPLRGLVRDTAIALQSDFRAQSDAGRIGPSLFLHDYWSETGDAGMRSSMERAVALALMPAGRRLLRASRIHSRIAEKMRIPGGPGSVESIFVKAVHEIAAVQLMYRHAMSIKSETPHMKAMNRAYEMVLSAIATLDTLKSTWALADARAGSESGEQAGASREDDETTDVDLHAQQAVEDSQKEEVENRFGMVRLISDPAENLEINIRQALRTMKERDYRSMTGGNGSGSGSISSITRPAAKAPTDNPRGPDNAAIISLQTLRPDLRIQAATGAATLPMPLLAARTTTF